MKIPKGYREVKVGEMIRKGDFWYDGDLNDVVYAAVTIGEALRESKSLLLRPFSKTNKPKYSKPSVVMVKFDSQRKAKEFCKRIRGLNNMEYHYAPPLPKWWEIELI